MRDLESVQKGHKPGDISLTSRSLPQGQVVYLRKQRDVQYHTLIFDLIARQFEAARLDEAKASPVIQVLDPGRAGGQKVGTIPRFVDIGRRGSWFLFRVRAGDRFLRPLSRYKPTRGVPRGLLNFVVLSVSLHLTGAAMQILVVVVLYKQSPKQSRTIQSLIPVFERNPSLIGPVHVLLWDNSPVPASQVSLPFPFDLSHAGRNVGTSGAYNYALELAESLGCPWLLLLDQDTTVSEEFLRTMIAVQRTVSPDAGNRRSRSLYLFPWHAGLSSAAAQLQPRATDSSDLQRAVQRQGLCRKQCNPDARNRPARGGRIQRRVLARPLRCLRFSSAPPQRQVHVCRGRPCAWSTPSRAWISIRR